MKRARALIATLAMLGLAGCVSINRVPAGPVALSKGQSITLQSDWAEVTPVMPQRQNAVRVLSIDGPALNRLYLIQGLPSGQGMVKRIAKEKPVPVFRADLSPTELLEFIADSVTAVGFQRVETSNLRPGRFGGADALRFDLNGVTATGLDVSGTAQVAIVDQKLVGAIFLAPSEHYFPAMMPEIETMLSGQATQAAQPAAYQASYEERVAKSAIPPSHALAPPAPMADVANSSTIPLPTKSVAAARQPAPAPSQRCGFVEQANGTLKLVPCI